MGGAHLRPVLPPAEIRLRPLPPLAGVAMSKSTSPSSAAAAVASAVKREGWTEVS